ncbi:hypothetical protein QQZ08_011621, partial [Neonectria magnoliae]
GPTVPSKGQLKRTIIRASPSTTGWTYSLIMLSDWLWRIVGMKHIKFVKRPEIRLPSKHQNTAS